MHFLGEAGVKVEPVLLDEQHQQGVRGNHCLRGYQQRLLGGAHQVGLSPHKHHAVEHG